MEKEEIRFCREKDIRIIKHKKESSFTTLYNDCINDERLSANSLAVLVYIMSKPEDWKVMVSDLRRRFRVGRNKCYSIISELCTLGYMQRVQERLENGAFQGCLLQASDKPIFINKDNKQPVPEIQEYPFTENRDTENRDTENRDTALYIQNKDLLQNKENTKNGFSCEFEQFWNINPKKVDKQESKILFDRLLKEDYSNFQKIMDGRRAQNVVIEFQGTEQRFIKGPVSWLKKRKFEDEVQTEEQLREESERVNVRASQYVSKPMHYRESTIEKRNNLVRKIREDARAEARRVFGEEGYCAQSQVF